MPLRKMLDDGEVTWPKPLPPGPGATIGERFEYSLAEGVRSFLELFDEPLAEVGAWVLRLVIKVLEKSTAGVVTPLIDSILQTPNLPEEVTEFLEGMKTPQEEGEIAGLMGFAGQIGMSAASSLLAPLMRLLNYAMDKRLLTARTDPSIAFPMIWRNNLVSDYYEESLKELGWDEEKQAHWREIIRPRVSTGEMGVWYLRDKDRDGDFSDELLRRGYPQEEIDKIKELLNVIPPVQDIIRMAVREAWREDFAKAWGTDQDYMPVVGEWAEKVGLSEEWVQKYWRAHWELPSVMMGFEMLHRGVIDQTQLEELMRALDIMPGWRDKLIDISYNVFTRVDTRRMHKMGILDEAGVKTSYMEQGYDDDKAGKMTEFTIAINTEEEREATKTDILTAQEEEVISRDESKEYLMMLGYQELWAETYVVKVEHKIEEKHRKEEEARKNEELVKEREATKADILSSYKDKLISRDETEEYLAAILYPASVIELLLARVDYELTQKMIREEIATTRVLYVNEDIDVSGVHVRLGKYALPASQVEELITLWNFERERKTERPSISQCLAFYYNGTYLEDKLRTQLAKNKLSAEYIQDYVTDANYLILKREQAELERQQKEQEWIDTSAFRTDRMVEIAAINVAIQEWKVVIADLKTVMLRVVPPGTKIQMTTQIRVREERIAELQVSIAERKEEITQAIELVPTLEDPEEIKTLRATILSLKTDIAGVEVEIAILREEVAGIRTELSTVVEPDEKLAYTEQIAIAQGEIARLQLEKAQVPVAPPGEGGTI